MASLQKGYPGVANFSNYAINGLGLLFFKNKPADNILLLLAYEGV